MSGSRSGAGASLTSRWAATVVALGCSRVAERHWPCVGARPWVAAQAASAATISSRVEARGGASRLNLVARWFGELTARMLRRGVHRSVDELNADIEHWVEHWNENPKPYVWTKTAEQILDTLAAYCKRITDSGH